MCGRFAFRASRKRLKEEFELPYPEETLPELLLRYQRCLIPARGFYEWQKANGMKVWLE